MLLGAGPHSETIVSAGQDTRPSLPEREPQHARSTQYDQSPSDAVRRGAGVALGADTDVSAPTERKAIVSVIGTAAEGTGLA